MQRIPLIDQQQLFYFIFVSLKALEMTKDLQHLHDAMWRLENHTLSRNGVKWLAGLANEYITNEETVNKIRDHLQQQMREEQGINVDADEKRSYEMTQIVEDILSLRREQVLRGMKDLERVFGTRFFHHYRSDLGHVAKRVCGAAN